MVYEIGKPIQGGEGKTKVPFRVIGSQHLVNLVITDDITAYNGKFHHVVSGLGEIQNDVTCRLFSLLEACNIPVAFVCRQDDTSFIAHWCDMLKFEVVCRGRATGSVLKRRPELSRGQALFPTPVEYFLKTSNKQWCGRALPVDDPFVLFLENGNLALHDPAVPIGEPFMVIPGREVFGSHDVSTLLAQIEHETPLAFNLLADAFDGKNASLWDMKFEWGQRKQDRKWVIADDLGPACMRLTNAAGEKCDKDPYRETGSPELALAAFEKNRKLVRQISFC